MCILKDCGRRIANGLLFGIGFGVSVGLIYYFVSEKLSETMMKSVWNEAAVEKVVVTAHEEVKRNDGTFILGTIDNRSGESVRMATIRVDLFDKAGQFVDQCSSHMTTSVRAGEQRNFKVDCGSKDKPVTQHETYKIRVDSM